MRVIFALMRRLLALTLLLVLVPATRAAAADYYVTDGGSGAQCTQDAPCSLSSALFIADGTPEFDRIHVVGPLLWPSPVNLTASPIELIGSGAGTPGTFVDVTSDTAISVGASSTVRDVKARSDDHPAFELTSGATLTGIAAQTDMPSPLSSVRVLPGSATTRIDDSAITAPQTTGLTARAPFELTHSTVTAKTGVSASTISGTSRIERSNISATQLGVLVTAADVKVASVLVVTTGSSAEGIHANDSASGGPVGHVTIRGSTIRHSGSPGVGTSGLLCKGEDSGSARGDVSLRSSIVRGYEKDLVSLTLTGMSGRIAVDHSDFHLTEGAGIEDGGSNVDLDPHWLGPATE